ncbi:MAG: hypothetical protein FJX03_07715 [Alphaproteobacteria bacterium]|nr:hypothetical protein [Alphaproteobacteria bacterium]
MKVISKIFTICILEIFINIFSPVLANEKMGSSEKGNPYSWLDDGIYNQTRLTERVYNKNKPPITSEELEDIEKIYDDGIITTILQELIDQKIYQLETRVFPTLQEDLNKLEQRIKQSGNSPYTITAEVVGGVFSQMTTFVLFSALESISGPVLFGVAGAGLVGETLKAADRIFRPSQMQLSLEYIKATLESEKDKIIKNVVNEVGISDLEIAYVLKKRFYPVKIQKKIEQTFMDARANSIFATDIRGVLKNYLRLPIKKKKLPWDPNLYDFNGNAAEDSKKIDDDSDNELNSYTNVTKHQLQRMALQLVASSNSSIPSAGRAFYFFGDPGTGKTNASRVIFEQLGLPACEISIRSPQDLTSAALEGESFGSKTSSFGHFVQTLLKGRNENEDDVFEDFLIRAGGSKKYSFNIRVQTQNTNETYKNSALILNDFDRVLLDELGNPQPQALGMLLDYLDPTKEEFHSNYFDVGLSIQDLIIVITANKKIPSFKPEPLLPVSSISSGWGLKAFVGGIGNISSNIMGMFWLNLVSNEEQLKICVNEEESQQHCSFNDDDAQELVNDPLAALRERIVEIPFFKLDVKIKRAILKRFLSFMKKKYLLENAITGKEEESILCKAEKVSSLRKAKVIVEEAVQAKKILNISSDKIKFQASEKKKDKTLKSEAKKLLKKSLVARAPLPLMTRIIPKVLTLQEIFKATINLTSDEDSVKLAALNDLFGYGGFLWGWGYVECLWSPKTWISAKAPLGGLAAVYARMARFEVPDEQHDVLRFHLQLVQYLTDILLQDFHMGYEENFIYREIMKCPRKQSNVRIFSGHLNELAFYDNNNGLEDNHEINKNLLKKFSLWLVEGEKVKQLKEKYKF